MSWYVMVLTQRRAHYSLQLMNGTRSSVTNTAGSRLVSSTALDSGHRKWSRISFRTHSVATDDFEGKLPPQPVPAIPLGARRLQVVKTTMPIIPYTCPTSCDEDCERSEE